MHRSTVGAQELYHSSMQDPRCSAHTQYDSYYEMCARRVDVCRANLGLSLRSPPLK